MTMVLDIHAEIAELRAELAHCILPRKGTRRPSPRRPRSQPLCKGSFRESARGTRGGDWFDAPLRDLGIVPELEPRPDHAGYLGSWLKVLADDKQAIFQAAAHTQRAVAYLHGLQPRVETKREDA